MQCRRSIFFLGGGGSLGPVSPTPGLVCVVVIVVVFFRSPFTISAVACSLVALVVTIGLARPKG